MGETSSAHEPSASVKKEHSCGLLPGPSTHPLFSSWEGRKEGAQECCFLSKPVSEKKTLCWILFFFFFSKNKLYAKSVITYKLEWMPEANTAKGSFSSWELISHLAKESIHVPGMITHPGGLTYCSNVYSQHHSFLVVDAPLQPSQNLTDEWEEKVSTSWLGDLQELLRK